MSVSNSTDSLRDQFVALRTSRVRIVCILAWLVLAAITLFKLGGHRLPQAVGTVTLLSCIALLAALWAIVFTIGSYVERRNGHQKDIVRAIVIETTVSIFLPVVLALVACHALMKLEPRTEGLLPYLVGFLSYFLVILTTVFVENLVKAYHKRRFLKR